MYASARLATIHRAFQTLWSLEGGPLHGRFILLWDGEAQAAAARIAGACALFIAEDAGEARRTVRTGAADFLVTSLDEALRILKIELRRKTPASVCLRAPIEETLRACVERGVQPDYLGAPEPILEGRGARLICWRKSTEAGGDAERAHWLRRAPSTLGRVEAKEVGSVYGTFTPGAG